MDEAFVPISRVVAGMLVFGELVDDDAGVRSYVHRCEIESPVELDIGRDAQGVLQIGTTPPLYYVDTSYRPSFHRLTFKAELTEPRRGDQ
jgi:hypothetical protein